MVTRKTTDKRIGKPSGSKEPPRQHENASDSSAGQHSSRTSPSLGNRFARITAPPELSDPEKRRKWGLPDDPEVPGSYIIELNAEHIDGLPGAEAAFKTLYQAAMRAVPLQGKPKAKKSATQRPYVKIAKSYYRCDFTDGQWRWLVTEDEKKARRDRAVYRLWPDFPVEAHTDRSMATIKADAAIRSFDASGDKIIWAVIDSGIQSSHPHFGPANSPEDWEMHTLLAKEVVGLHRCFTDVYRYANGMPITEGVLPDVDWDTGMDPEMRKQLLNRHREQALRDEYGHGTHVAGIIAGHMPGNANQVHVFERQYHVDDDKEKKGEPRFVERSLPANATLSGVAPRCKLISLKVLDHNGKGRASQVIQALEYIRDKINDNPKLMRVHGVNLSVGYEFDAEMFACGQSPLCTTVDRLVQEGVVVVAAAGNTGFGSVAAAVGTTKVGLSNTINDPGNAALAITVGSTHRDSPHTYGVSYFSSKGPTADGRLKPDLVAPGERITSCAAGKKLDGLQQVHATSGEKPACCYVDDSGTSMAAPHVSGAIAAFLSIRREFIGKPLEVKRIFLDSATPLGREQYFEGRGMVDLMRAIQRV